MLRILLCVKSIVGLGLVFFFPALELGEKTCRRIYHGTDMWSHLAYPVKLGCWQLCGKP